jgi:predicted ATPase
VRIEKLRIKNFKSIYDLELNVGRVNLLIGENGSGKSNLLEALVFLSAHQSNKLDNEFLFSRGLRVTEPQFMRSAFKENIDNIEINVKFLDSKNYTYEFENDNNKYSEWKKVSKDKNKVEKLKSDLSNLHKIVEKLDEKSLNEINSLINGMDTMLNNSESKQHLLKNFIIYSPENTSLRIFEKEGQIQPLGINGEGLLKLLKVINNYEDKSYIQTIVKSLQLFNWFEDIAIPKDINSIESKVIIKDKYLYTEFDQRSANEGFLFILFYITLIVAKETPKVFAIDNIDASLNPKLCTKLMIIITELSEKYDKQIFLTTHNPAILDGVDLNDNEQKLFVVSRNKSGHTRIKNIGIKDKPKSSTNEPLKLSEAFLRGYLGGLPKGF